MTSAARLRPLFLPTLLMLPVLAILLGLGSWQVRRMHWKHAILRQIAAAEAGPPTPLRDPPEPITKVTVTGRFLHDREAIVGLEVRGAVLGGALVTPLEWAGGPPVLVNRGWVPLEPQGPVNRPAGEVSVTGWVRPPDTTSSFSATDDVAKRRFYSFVPGTIGQALGLPAVEPYAVVALANPAPANRAAAPARPADRVPAELPAPSEAMPRPDDPHLGYAITWYGIAAALVGVYAAFVARRLRAPTPSTSREIPA
ncbi:SURF1 family protein [Roseomonas elaeocarpi]|uniref:SURF1-like protein n=1 Tax=Roseomonas elaeocarpi TaxID=907779 RepID=A0ABV6JZ77_9PROT